MKAYFRVAPIVVSACLALLAVAASGQSVSPASVSVPVTEVGASGTETFDVTNDGAGLRTVTDIASYDAQFTVAPTSFSLDVDQSQPIVGSFTPGIVGLETATLTMTHDGAGVTTLTASGVGSVTPARGHPQDTRITASRVRLNGSLVAAEFVHAMRVSPYALGLRANYPNPFNPETWIPFELSADSTVVVDIYALGGRRVRTLDLGARTTGEHTTRDAAAYWDGRNDLGEAVASGTYVYELRAGDERSARRMVLLK